MLRDRATAAALLASMLGACREPSPPRSTPPSPGADRGLFALTYYWIAIEGEGVRETTLYQRDCEPATRVTATFARELDLAGTGRLHDGRIIGVERSCRCPRSPCVEIAGGDLAWGLGAASRPLVAFRSVAVDPDVIPLGTSLYIRELDGITLPGFLFPHDGCVRADDRGDRIEAARIDWFVGSKLRHAVLDARVDLQTVTVADGGARCPAN